VVLAVTTAQDRVHQQDLVNTALSLPAPEEESFMSRCLNLASLIGLCSTQ
jgi:hypothetical protein